jgi:hypothetical protein
MNRNILVHAHNTRSQDEYSTRCIFAQMPAISIRTAVQLSRLSILHELSSTDTARRRTRKTVICAGRALADCTEDEIGGHHASLSGTGSIVRVHRANLQRCGWRGDDRQKPHHDLRAEDASSVNPG